jgi:hypothetical protein
MIPVEGGDPVPGTISRLLRFDDRIIVRVDTERLEPGAYTLWWEVYNHPEFCVRTCDDPTNPAAQGFIAYAAGAVVGQDGNATFMAELRDGDISGVPQEWAHASGAKIGLVNPHQAIVYVAIRSHGAASADPAVLNEQLTKFNGGCNPECKNVQVSTHEPLNPIVLGDSNDDGRFDEADLIQVFQAGKYESGQPASFSEGDWNGDGVFNTSDLIAAFQTGNYRRTMNANRGRSLIVDDLVKNKAAVDEVFETLSLISL